MPSIQRRSFLEALGATASVALAGCSTLTDRSDDLPAGSLTFRSDHDVPHELGLEVLDVGTSLGDRENGHETVVGTPDIPVSERDLTTTVMVEPDETRTYESVLRSPVWYDIRFTIDDDYPGEDLARTVIYPDRRGEDHLWQRLEGRVSEAGELSWAVASTDNPGPF